MFRVEVVDGISQKRHSGIWRVVGVALAVFATQHAAAASNELVACARSLTSREQLLAELTLSPADLGSDAHLEYFELKASPESAESAEGDGAEASLKPVKLSQFSSGYFARAEALEKIFRVPKAQLKGAHGTLVWEPPPARENIAQRESGRAAFREIQKALEELHLRPASLEVERAIYNEATARALDYVHASGINVKILYELPAGTLALELARKGEHRLNRFAQSLHERHAGATVRFDPSTVGPNRARFHEARRVFYAGHEMILEPKLKDEAVLHELFHSRNGLRLAKGEAYPFYGGFTARQGRIPGLTAAYENEIRADEAENHLHTLRNLLSLLMSAVDRGDVEETVRIYRNARDIFVNGYSAAVRNVALADWLLNGVSEVEFVDVGGIQFAKVQLQDSESDVQGVVPLLGTGKGAVAAGGESYFALRAQSKDLRDGSEGLKIQFDFALRVIYRAALLFRKYQSLDLAKLSLKALQSSLRPVDKANLHGRSIDEITELYNLEVQRLIARMP